MLIIVFDIEVLDKKIKVYLITSIMLIIDLMYIPEKDTAASDFERLKKFLMFRIINSMDKIFFQFLVTHVCNTLSSKEINWQPRK